MMAKKLFIESLDTWDRVYMIINFTMASGWSIEARIKPIGSEPYYCWAESESLAELDDKFRKVYEEAFNVKR